MIIGLSGLKRSGKDTIADYLVAKYGFIRFAFADAIYAEVSQAFGVPEDKLRSTEWKTQPQSELSLRNCNDSEFVRMVIAAELPNADGGVFSACNRLQSPYCSEIQTAPRTSTFIVQRWSTEFRRIHQNDNLYWTRKVDNQLAALPDYSKIVFSDVRYIHEIELMERYTARHKLLRSGLIRVSMIGSMVHTGHSSDDALPTEYIDHHITNVPGDFAGLYQQVDQFIMGGIKWKQTK